MLVPATTNPLSPAAQHPLLLRTLAQHFHPTALPVSRGGLYPSLADTQLRDSLAEMVLGGQKQPRCRWSPCNPQECISLRGQNEPSTAPQCLSVATGARDQARGFAGPHCSCHSLLVSPLGCGRDLCMPRELPAPQCWGHPCHPSQV